MIKKPALLVAMLTIAALAACSTVNMTSDWDPDFDFSQAQTFVVIYNGTPGISRLVDARIRAAIVADLTDKGFQRVGTADQADLAVGYQVATEDRRTYRTMHSAWGTDGFRHHNNRWGATTGTSRTTQTTYTLGTLLVAVFETGSNELVWEASGDRRLSDMSDPTESQERINEDVQKIMRDFPPGA